MPKRANAHRFSSLRSACLLLLASLVTTSAFAQDRASRDQAAINELKSRFAFPAEFSDADLKEEAKAYLDGLEADYRERKRNEAASVEGVVGSASVVARCADGYVTGRRIQTSARDVEVASEQRADCDNVGCKALQVNARRPSQERFSVSVSVSCSS